MDFGKEPAMSKASNFVEVDDAFMARFDSIPGIDNDREDREAARVEMERIFAANLSAIRKAAQLTQNEIAASMGMNQSAVSRLESQNDMLLSTLLGYLNATGAESASIVLVVRGQRVELDLESLRRATESVRDNSRHVVPSVGGGWDVVKPGSGRASSHHHTQAEAIDRAREIVRNAGGGELRIHGRDGRVRESDSVQPASRRASREQSGRD
jgi:DNA-binding transcriptional regulator YiaG